MRRLVLALVLAVSAQGAAAAEDLMAKARIFVQDSWQTPGPAEDAQKVGFTGSFTAPGSTTKRPIRCDGGFVGRVTYTAFEGGVCAAYPYRQASNGEIFAKIALAFEGEAVMETLVHRRGGGSSSKGGSASFQPNPENETPEDRAAAERGKRMAACAPKTVSQAMACLDEHWDASTKKTFAALAAKDVIMSHFGVGMWIRNNWGLWGGGPLNQVLSAQGVTHPDSMSSVILDAYWLKLQGCKLAWDEAATIQSAFKAAQTGPACPA